MNGHIHRVMVVGAILRGSFTVSWRNQGGSAEARCAHKRQVPFQIQRHFHFTRAGAGKKEAKDKAGEALNKMRIANLESCRQSEELARPAGT